MEVSFTIHEWKITRSAEHGFYFALEVGSDLPHLMHLSPIGSCSVLQCGHTMISRAPQCLQ